MVVIIQMDIHTVSKRGSGAFPVAPSRPQFTSTGIKSNPPTFSELISWIQSNPTREFTVPDFTDIVTASAVKPVAAPVVKPTAPAVKPPAPAVKPTAASAVKPTAASAVKPPAPVVKPAMASAVKPPAPVPGPWPDTKRINIVSKYPYTSAILASSEFSWNEITNVKRQQLCEENANALYLEWPEMYKTGDYRTQGIKQTDVETILTNTSTDPDAMQIDALQVLAAKHKCQFIRIYPTTAEFDTVPQKWIPDVQHHVIVYENGHPADTPKDPIVVSPISSKWTNEKLKTLLKMYTLTCIPKKKDINTKTVAALRAEAEECGASLPAKATKEQIWIAIQRQKLNDALC